MYISLSISYWDILDTQCGVLRGFRLTWQTQNKQRLLIFGNCCQPAIPPSFSTCPVQVHGGSGANPNYIQSISIHLFFLQNIMILLSRIKLYGCSKVRNNEWMSIGHTVKWLVPLKYINIKCIIILYVFFFLLKKENAEPCNLFKGIWGTDIKSTHTKMSEKYLQHRFCVADTLCACFCQAELFTQREPVDINTPENR